jgi:hypothetical protein
VLFQDGRDAGYTRLVVDTEAPGGADIANLTREAMFRRLERISGSANAMGSVDDELAVLVFDSDSDSDSHSEANFPRPVPATHAAAAVRSGESATRQLTFESHDLALEAEIDKATRELTIQVIPPQPASLDIRHAEGTIDLGRDEYGFFHTTVPLGSVSLRCRPAAGADVEQAIATSWLAL